MDETAYSLALPFAFGLPPVTAVFKASADDFIVDECLPFTVTGAGEHVLLHIRKTDLNTQDVVKLIAKFSGVSERNISYAGLKDKHAVTSQWFSVQQPIGKELPWQAMATAQLTILEAVRHSRKLRRGAVSHNRFVICLRQVQGDIPAMLQRLTLIVEQGVPNYFGSQRFAANGRNLSQAQRMFAGEIEPRRFERGIYLSAARSWLFNQVLAERIVDHSWNQGMDGDVFWLEGTKRFFSSSTMDETLRRRLVELDIHPTGPLWGKGELATQDQVRALELFVIAKYTALAQGLESMGLEQDRRALRITPQDFHYRYNTDEQQLTLEFNLAAGGYATALLREIAVTTGNISSGEPELIDEGL